MHINVRCKQPWTINCKKPADHWSLLDTYRYIDGIRISSTLITWQQGFTKRCRLSLLTNSALVIRVQMRGEWGSCGASANEYSRSQHVTWSPKKLFRSTSIFNLCLTGAICINCAPNIYKTIQHFEIQARQLDWENWMKSPAKDYSNTFEGYSSHLLAQKENHVLFSRTN
jgi:hypothetical protein